MGNHHQNSVGSAQTAWGALNVGLLNRILGRPNGKAAEGSVGQIPDKRPRKPSGRPKKYEVGQEPWTLAGVTRSTWFAQRGLREELSRIKLVNEELESELKGAKEQLATVGDVAGAKADEIAADRVRLEGEITAANATIEQLRTELDALKQSTVPLDNRLLGLLVVGGITSDQQLRDLLALPAPDFDARMRSALQQRAIERQVLVQVAAQGNSHAR